MKTAASPWEDRWPFQNAAHVSSLSIVRKLCIMPLYLDWVAFLLIGSIWSWNISSKKWSKRILCEGETWGAKVLKQFSAITYIVSDTNTISHKNASALSPAAKQDESKTWDLTVQPKVWQWNLSHYSQKQSNMYVKLVSYRRVLKIWVLLKNSNSITGIARLSCA